MNARINKWMAAACMVLVVCVMGCTKGSGPDPVLPTILSFAPKTATLGDPVKISGKNFTGANSVTFGAAAAQSFTVVSDSVIMAYVGNGSSGAVTVTLPSGKMEFAGFTYYVPQEFNLAGTVRWSSLGTYPARDSSGYVFKDAVETGTLAIRKINVYDTPRIRTSISPGNMYISPYVNDPAYVILSGLVDDSYQLRSYGNPVPGFKLSSTSTISVFAKIQDTLIIIPEQGPVFPITVKGSGVLKNGKLTLQINSDYRHEAKNTIFVSQ